MDKNIVSLRQWKQRLQLMNEATSVGWDVKPRDLVDINDPLSFYICEPLQSRFLLTGVFRFADLKRIVKRGTKHYASTEQLAEAVVTVTNEVLDGTLRADKDTLHLMLFAHFMNFATTKTAKLVVDAEGAYQHVGTVVYRNPLRSDGFDTTLRPLALSHPTRILEPGLVAMGVVQNLLADAKNHPEMFTGIDLEAAIAKLMAPFPHLLP